MNQDSFIKMSSSDIVYMCEKAIRSIKEYRSTRANEYLDDLVKARNNGFFHKLFKKKDVTREDMKRYSNAQRGCDGFDWHYVLPYKWEKNLKTALRLKRAARATEKEMLISASDYGKISVF